MWRASGNPEALCERGRDWITHDKSDWSRKPEGDSHIANSLRAASVEGVDGGTEEKSTKIHFASALFDNSRRRSPRELRERSGRGCRRLRALGSLDAPPRYPSGASGCSKPAENRLGNPFSLALSAGLVVVVNFLRESAACLPLATSARCFGSPRRRSSRLPRSRSRSPVRRGSWAAASSSPSSTRTSTDATTAWSPARSSSCPLLPGTS